MTLLLTGLRPEPSPRVPQIPGSSTKLPSSHRDARCPPHPAHNAKSSSSPVLPSPACQSRLCSPLRAGSARSCSRAGGLGNSPVSPRGGSLRGWGPMQYNRSHHDECQLLVQASNLPTFRPSRLPLPHLEDSAPSLWPQLLVQVTSPVRAFLPSCPLPVLFLYSPYPIHFVYHLAL